jgi:hypothetical protein
MISYSLNKGLEKKGAKSLESAPNPCNQISVLLDAEPEFI